MRSIVELITVKRDGGRLTDREIEHLINAYSNDTMPDYQMAALAMAIYFNGLDAQERATWTRAMLHSGEVLDLSELGTALVDKHSTGGVGDKVSLPLAPAAAACGCVVPMVSGRGLGHTGGTIDKLESIPGYRADLSIDAFKEVLRKAGCAIIGQTADIAPADKRLYALRDVTATVPSLPLITASIMSKKLAEGIGGLVLDVKVGRGAFMKTEADARRLAEAMVEIGESMGTRVIAFLTRMEEPLGHMVGNAVEVKEAMDVLSGGGPSVIRELVVTLGGAMVEIAHGVSEQEGKAAIAEALDSGTAMSRWEQMVEAQGGRLDELYQSGTHHMVSAPRSGYISAIDALEIGLTGVALGAGRTHRDDEIDAAVGLEILAPRGSYVDEGAPLLRVFEGKEPVDPTHLVRLQSAFTLTDMKPAEQRTILGRVG